MRKLFVVILTFFILFSVGLYSQTWSPIKRLTWKSSWTIKPMIAIDSENNIHIVWHDELTKNEEIYYKRSSDAGVTWSERMRLTWNEGESMYPSVTTDSTNCIHLVWSDGFAICRNIFYKRSTDDGATWTTQKKLTWNLCGANITSITADIDNRLHVVWSDYRLEDFEIFYKYSSDSGITWSDLKRLTWNSGDSKRPSIVVDSEKVIHVVWYDDSPGNPEIFYKHSCDGGVSWSGIKRLSWNNGYSCFPIIRTNSTDNRLHVVWSDNSTGKFEVYYKFSCDGGDTWSKQKRFTWNLIGSYGPSIAIDSVGGINLVYSGDSGGNLEIYHSNSIDNGATWSVPQRITWSPGWADFLSIEADSLNGIHLVWQDNRTGSWEIYYKNRK